MSGWGGAGPKWVDPKEQQAANEAAAAMERQQQAEDGRTEALATAIIEGFGMVANAILAAAGLANAGTFTDGVAGVHTSAEDEDMLVNGAEEVGADPDLDGLLDDEGDRAADEQQ